MSNLTFLKFGMVKLLETSHTVSNVNRNIFHIKIFEEIIFFLVMIQSFLKLKCYRNSRKSFPLTVIHCNWPTNHAIDHNSTGYNKLTIQTVYNLLVNTWHDMTWHDMNTSGSQRTTLIVSFVMLRSPSTHLETMVQTEELYIWGSSLRNFT